MAKKRRNVNTAMIDVDADYIKACIKKQGGALDRISREMGYNETYLSYNLSRNRQVLLPVVLDYLAKNYGIDKDRATQKKEETQEDIDLRALSVKVDMLIGRVKELDERMYAIHKAIVDMKELWK